MRLDKFLSDMNKGTRKELKQLVRQGRVAVNGVTATNSGMAVNESDCIEVDGESVVYAKYEYYVMNKPQGVITATEDSRQDTVLDLMEENRRKDLFPVGRLDKDTVGLLLITNDGDLNHRLLSPKKHVDKEYVAKISGQVTEEDVKTFAKGVFIEDGFRALPAELKILSYREKATEEDLANVEHSNAPQKHLSQGITEISIVIHEGKYHQVKKMFHAIGKEVFFLKRIRMGTLLLNEELAEGTYRKLTADEVKWFNENHLQGKIEKYKEERKINMKFT